MKILILALFSTMILASCRSDSGRVRLPEQPNATVFDAYWHQGKAEISRFALKQARYGEIHEGDAVLIFVTEPFLTKEQVKRDSGDKPAEEVLKLNATRKFNTGIYPYSLMTSTFTTTSFKEPKTPKVSFSGQEWCGHVYMQLNQERKGYRAQLHSYFQAEVDVEEVLPNVPTEDGIWTSLRIAPQQLPLGTLKMIPALHFMRLGHTELKAYKVVARLESSDDDSFGKDLLTYTLNYPALKRKLEIFFESAAPHRIMGWREEGLGGRGEERKVLVTEAHRTHEMLTDYWNKNSAGDIGLREQLGLAQ